jgi:hypothetical protein
VRELCGLLVAVEGWQRRGVHSLTFVKLSTAARDSVIPCGKKGLTQCHRRTDPTEDGGERVRKGGVAHPGLRVARGVTPGRTVRLRARGGGATTEAGAQMVQTAEGGMTTKPARSCLATTRRRRRMPMARDRMANGRMGSGGKTSREMAPGMLAP